MCADDKLTQEKAFRNTIVGIRDVRGEGFPLCSLYTENNFRFVYSYKRFNQASLPNINWIFAIWIMKYRNMPSYGSYNYLFSYCFSNISWCAGISTPWIGSRVWINYIFIQDYMAPYGSEYEHSRKILWGLRLLVKAWFTWRIAMGSNSLWLSM